MKVNDIGLLSRSFSSATEAVERLYRAWIMASDETPQYGRSLSEQTEWPLAPRKKIVGIRTAKARKWIYYPLWS